MSSEITSGFRQWWTLTLGKNRQFDFYGQHWAAAAICEYEAKRWGTIGTVIGNPDRPAPPPMVIPGVDDVDGRGAEITTLWAEINRLKDKNDELAEEVEGMEEDDCNAQYAVHYEKEYHRLRGFCGRWSLPSEGGDEQPRTAGWGDFGDPLPVLTRILEAAGYQCGEDLSSFYEAWAGYESPYKVELDKVQEDLRQADAEIALLRLDQVLVKGDVINLVGPEVSDPTGKEGRPARERIQEMVKAVVDENQDLKRQLKAEKKTTEGFITRYRDDYARMLALWGELWRVGACGVTTPGGGLANQVIDRGQAYVTNLVRERDEALALVDRLHQLAIAANGLMVECGEIGIEDLQNDFARSSRLVDAEECYAAHLANLRGDTAWLEDQKVRMSHHLPFANPDLIEFVDQALANPAPIDSVLATDPSSSLWIYRCFDKPEAGNE